jgi:hypothetical protein
MKCPNCGRFMRLEIFDDVSKDAFESAFWWCCSNNNCFMVRPECAIAAPEYDWLYWYKDIPKEDLDNEEMELRTEWEQAREAYLKRKR